MLYSAHFETPLGPVLLAGDGESLAGLWMEGQKYYGGTVAGDLAEQPDLPVFTAAKSWLDAYFAGRKPPISDLPLAPKGGDFRKAVLKLLCEIPYVELTTYG